jgi:hypothetical protein
MRLTVLLLAVAVSNAPVCATEKPEEAVARILRSEPTGGYNPVNKSPEEMVNADAINADLGFARMLADSNEAMLKTCYALRILNARRSQMEHVLLDTAGEKRATVENHIRKIDNDRKVLVELLRDLRQRKQSQSSALERAEPRHAEPGVGSDSR